MKISEIYGKIIESTEGKRGYVLRVKASRGAIECLVCADEEEREFVVDMRNVIKVGEKILYEDRACAIKRARELVLGRVSFDEDGNFLGNLEEVTFSGSRLVKAKIGKKSYSPEELSCRDAVIVRPAARLSSDVTKKGDVVLKKGAPLNGENLSAAAARGEYIQARLKSI